MDLGHQLGEIQTTFSVPEFHIHDLTNYESKHMEKNAFVLNISELHLY
jgi:hypothetical protein